MAHVAAALWAIAALVAAVAGGAALAGAGAGGHDCEPPRACTHHPTPIALPAPGFPAGQFPSSDGIVQRARVPYFSISGCTSMLKPGQACGSDYHVRNAACCPVGFECAVDAGDSLCSHHDADPS
jgi:hypothetical protein